MAARAAGRTQAREQLLLPPAADPDESLRQGRAPDHASLRARPAHSAGRLPDAAVSVAGVHHREDQPVSANGSAGMPMSYWRLKLRAMALLLLGRSASAEAVFGAMLARWPDDGYALSSRSYLRAQ